ncbi:MAG: DUF924 family protein [Myxococcota bacterium]
MTLRSADDVLHFWLGELDESGRASEQRSERWWRKSDEFDRECLVRFESTRDAALAGELERWLDSTRGRLAFAILLDQLSRNMYRNTARMYEADARAVEVVLEAIDAGLDKTLGFHERYFLYMPLMHAEDIALQERCIALFHTLGADFPECEQAAQKAVGFAEQHRDIVARFGRFPHRNKILGREDTREERVFLKQPNSGF